MNQNEPDEKKNNDLFLFGFGYIGFSLLVYKPLNTLIQIFEAHQLWSMLKA